MQFSKCCIQNNTCIPIVAKLQERYRRICWICAPLTWDLGVSCSYWDLQHEESVPEQVLWDLCVEYARFSDICFCFPCCTNCLPKSLVWVYCGVSFLSPVTKCGTLSRIILFLGFFCIGKDYNTNNLMYVFKSQTFLVHIIFQEYWVSLQHFHTKRAIYNPLGSYFFNPNILIYLFLIFCYSVFWTQCGFNQVSLPLSYNPIHPSL